MVLKKSTLGKLTYSRHFQRVVIIATKSENVLIHFKSDFFVAVAIFTKDNATANRTARAQENNRLGLGRELGRVARKSDFSKEQQDVRNVKAHVLEVRLFVGSVRY